LHLSGNSIFFQEIGGHHNYLFFIFGGVIPYEKQKSKPTIRRRKNLLDCNMTDILYDDLRRLYVQECRLKNLVDVTIKGYEFAHKHFTECTQR